MLLSNVYSTRNSDSSVLRIIGSSRRRFTGTDLANRILSPLGSFLGAETLTCVLVKAMASVASKLYSDDVSLLVLLLDTNPFFWDTTSTAFSQFLSHVLAFLNAVLGLNQLNQVVVIATGYSSCDYIYDSSLTSNVSSESRGTGMPALFGSLLEKLEDFIAKDEELSREEEHVDRIASSLLSGSLSMALCYIQRVFRSGHLHPQPRILCLQGSPDGPEQYVAVMNSIFSAQRLMVPIDSCYIGSQNSAFLQQASYITGGVHHAPKQLDGLFQFLTTIFATDLHTRGFVQLPKPVGVDFRASCFCHKKTIDMGYVCSVCLSIFCEHHQKCSTCGSVFGQSKLDGASSSVNDRKRKAPDS